MAGTESTFVGMPMATISRTTVGKNTADSKMGNPLGDVVENTQEARDLGFAEAAPNLSTNKGAYIGMQSKAPEIQ